MAASNAARDAAKQLKAIQRRADVRAPTAAVKALTLAGQVAAKSVLTKTQHKLGTRTPSEPGQPPAKVSGKLSKSPKPLPVHAAGGGTATQILAAYLVYAPVHEFGPVTIRAKRFPQLGNPEVGFFGPEVTIPRRPWMKPAVAALIASGVGTEVCSAAFAKAILSGITAKGE